MQRTIGLALAFALATGVLIGTQSSITSMVGKSLPAARTGLLVNLFGGSLAGLILLAGYLLQRHAPFIGTTPASLGLTALAGLIGVAIIIGVASALPTIGVAAGLSAIIAGQMVVGLVVDTLGLTGGEPIPLSWLRLAGIGLMALGTLALLPRK